MVDHQEAVRPGTSEPMLLGQPTPLVGRAGELILSGQTLVRDEVRLLTMRGPAGVGKTRLALALGESMFEKFDDGVVFVDLAPISDPGLVVAAIAEAVGLRDTAGQSPLAALATFLQDRRMLLILDNFEHVLPAAEHIAALLARAHSIKILVTSREALRVRWEQVFPVLPLALPAAGTWNDLKLVSEAPAVRVFVNRAQAADPSFALTQTSAPVVAEICTLLDGLPLAIELAAARTSMLTPKALLARLSDRLGILVDGARDLPERHRTLRNAIRYSYDLLSDDEKSLFCRLGVFGGGCSLEAASAVLQADSNESQQIVDRLAALTGKSLLLQHHLADGELRFEMLHTVRALALDELSRSDQLQDVRARWLEYLRSLAERAARELLGANQSVWIRILEREHDNLRTGLRWCIAENQAAMGLQIATALQRFWSMRGISTEGRAWLTELLSLPAAGPRTAIRAAALAAAGALAYSEGDFAATENLEQESLAIWRELGDAHESAASLDVLGQLAHRRGDSTQATALLEESLTYKRELGNTWGVADGLHHLGMVAAEQGHVSMARARFRESLLCWNDLGDTLSVAMVLDSIAILAESQGHMVRALRLASSAEEIRTRLGDVSCQPIRQIELQRVLESAERRLDKATARLAIKKGRAMTLDEAVVFACAAEMSASRPVPQTLALPAKGPLAWLTKREREVGGLLMRGLSNRQIAEELVISERTAETHVCRVLSKLNLDSRAQFAVLVTDQQLIPRRVAS